jgi:hypothetical protein
MTPADFDRPFVDEATERFVEQSRPPEPRTETRQESRDEPREERASASESDEKPSGERKRGWWKRVLS